MLRYRLIVQWPRCVAVGLYLNQACRTALPAVDSDTRRLSVQSLFSGVRGKTLSAGTLTLDFSTHSTNCVGGGHVLFVDVFVCQQGYWKSNQPILVKYGVTIGPTNGNNRWWWSGPGYGSLFSLPSACRRFISISHSYRWADFHETRRNDWRQQANKVTIFWERYSGHLDLDQSVNPCSDPV